MKDLIKRSFELWVKMRWLKLIDKEVNKYNKMNHKLNIQCKVVHDLVDAYTIKYGEELKVKK